MNKTSLDFSKEMYLFRLPEEERVYAKLTTRAMNPTGAIREYCLVFTNKKTKYFSNMFNICAIVIDPSG